MNLIGLPVLRQGIIDYSSGRQTIHPLDSPSRRTLETVPVALQDARFNQFASV